MDDDLPERGPLITDVHRNGHDVSAKEGQREVGAPAVVIRTRVHRTRPALTHIGYAGRFSGALPLSRVVMLCRVTHKVG